MPHYKIHVRKNGIAFFSTSENDATTPVQAAELYSTIKSLFKSYTGIGVFDVVVVKYERTADGFYGQEIIL